MENDKKKYDGFAVASFSLGIIGLLFGIIFPIATFFTNNYYIIILIPFIFSVISITFGLVSKNKIKKTKSNGKKIATTGIVISIISLLLIIFNIYLYLNGIDI